MVVVTGGASGIGEAIVEAFAANGAQVVFLDIQTEAAERLVVRLTDGNPYAPVFVPCDLTDMASLQSAIQSILREFDAVDVLVNNAGNDTRHTIDEVTPEMWDRLMAINLKQQFFMPSADQRTTYFTNIRYNQSVNTRPFAIKTDKKTTVDRR